MTPKVVYSGRTDEAHEAAKERARERYENGQYTSGGPPKMDDLQIQARQWPTPDASAMQLGETPKTWLARREKLKETANNGNGCGTPLAMSVQLPENWATPKADERQQQNSQDDYASLSKQVTNWPTPRKADDQGGVEPTGKTGRKLKTIVAGQPVQDSPSTTGKVRGCLSAMWVEQLMGFPDGWMDFF